MKRTPIKGRLDNFFSSLGKQLKSNRRDISGEFKGVKQKDKPRRSAAELNKPTDKEIKITTKNNLTLGSSKNKNIEAPKSEYGGFLEDAGGNPKLAMSIMANQDNILNDGYFGVNKKGKKDIFGNPDIVKTRVKGKNVPQTFKQAFAAARKADKKTFTYKGKLYTTKLA